MSTVTAPAPQVSPLADMQTIADLVEHLGGIPLERIRLHPTIGTATDKDVICAKGCELIDGVLVEKPMGYFESRLAVILGYFIETFLEIHNLGFTLGEEATQRIIEGKVRKPDLSFYLWERFPSELLPAVQILEMAPDWAVEVISPGNTLAEMDRKRGEYFEGGTHLVWQVYPETCRVRVFTAVDIFTEFGEDDTLDGSDVLPGFTLSIRRWFERAGQRAAKE